MFSFLLNDFSGRVRKFAMSVLQVSKAEVTTDSKTIGQSSSGEG
jgi:hypothetical protein